MRLALGLAYDGTRFNGYQTQPQGNTIQDHLEVAVGRFLESDPPETVAAGRTDAGVHALGQVVHLETNIDRPLWNWVRGINAFLVPDIRVRWAAHVPDDFHARFSATSRAYRYTLFNELIDSPLEHRFATWVFQPLDEHLMRQAAECLLGEHDFSAFRAAECQANSPVRVISRCEIHRVGSKIQIDLQANAFLHHMVRNIVGSLVEVGRGAQPPAWMAEILAAKDRTIAGRTFPAQGLCLAQVTYDNEFKCVPESKSVA